jgi:hypothetical protein
MNSEALLAILGYESKTSAPNKAGRRTSINQKTFIREFSAPSNLSLLQQNTNLNNFSLNFETNKI